MVEGSIDFGVNIVVFVFVVFDGMVDKFGVFGFFGGGEDEGRVGGGILGLVFGDGCGNMVSDVGFWKMYC